MSPDGGQLPRQHLLQRAASFSGSQAAIDSRMAAPFGPSAVGTYRRSAATSGARTRACAASSLCGIAKAVASYARLIAAFTCAAVSAGSVSQMHCRTVAITLTLATSSTQSVRLMTAPRAAGFRCLDARAIRPHAHRHCGGEKVGTPLGATHRGSLSLSLNAACISEPASWPQDFLGEAEVRLG